MAEHAKTLNKLLQSYSTPITIGEFKSEGKRGRRLHSRKSPKSITLANGDIITTTNRTLFGSLTLNVEPRRSYRVVLPNKIKKGV